jgi:hypothetical protein
MIYLKLFENHSEYEDFTGSTEYVEPHVSHCIDENDVHYNLEEPVIATDIRITETSVTLKDGDTYQLNVVFTPFDVADKSLDWYSSDDSVVTVADGLISVIDNVDGDYTISAVTKDGSDLTATCVVSVMGYVEIAGIKWTVRNIGAANETDAGLYFQWGDAKGYTASQVGSGEGQKYFGWADYKYNNGATEPTAADMTKYNSTDGKTVLDNEDDGALAVSKGVCRMPTYEEARSLFDNTTRAWDTNYKDTGVLGVIFTDKTDASKTVFFPICGSCDNGAIFITGDFSTYWLKGVYSEDLTKGDCIGFFGRTATIGNPDRYYGSTLRGIINE